MLHVMCYMLCVICMVRCCSDESCYSHNYSHNYHHYVFIVCPMEVEKFIVSYSHCLISCYNVYLICIDSNAHIL